LLGKLKLTSQLIIKTGIHIGGGGEKLEIGGLDKAVVRDPLTDYPYLPGSSIKGKFRSILERLLNKPVNRPGGSGTYRYESDDLESGFSEIEGHLIEFVGARICPISRLFGSTGTNCWIPTTVVDNQKLERINDPEKPRRHLGTENVEHTYVKGRNSPSRLIVHDCHLHQDEDPAKDSVKLLKQVDTGLYMTEWKFENGIDRITAAANPRQVERVPAGAVFDFEMVYTIEDVAQAKEDLLHLAIALAVLEDDALGGHGSRGYGKVEFQEFKLLPLNYRQYFPQPGEQSAIQQLTTSVTGESLNTKELCEKFKQLFLPPAEESQ
jgi:CRISPR-associated protein Csm3